MWLEHGFEASNLSVYLPVCLSDGPILLGMLLKQRDSQHYTTWDIPSPLLSVLRVPAHPGAVKGTWGKIKETWALVLVLLSSCYVALVRAFNILRPVSFCLKKGRKKKIPLVLPPHRLFRESSVIIYVKKLLYVIIALQVMLTLWSQSVLNGNTYVPLFWVPLNEKHTKML